MNTEQEFNSIFTSIDKVFQEIYKKKAELREQKRLKRLNDPYYKAKRTNSAKKAWETRRANIAKKIQDKIDEEEGRRLDSEYIEEHCTCHLGNPPCYFCMNSNYCEDCDINTNEDNCPKCGKNILR